MIYEFFSLISILWICLYTFNPDIVKIRREWEFFPLKEAYPDTLKCLILATIITLIFILILLCVNLIRSSKIKE